MSAPSPNHPTNAWWVPASWLRDPLFRHSVLLIAASQVGNVCNLAFQVVMMRRLPAAEFAVLSALLTLVLISAAPSEALRTAVAHACARLSKAGRGGEIRPVLRRWAGLVTLAAAAVLVAGIVARDPVARYLRIERPGLVVLMAAVMGGSLGLPLAIGILQGLERFRSVAVLGQLPAVARLGAGVVLVGVLGGGAGWALGAQALGVGLFLMAAAVVVPRALPAASGAPGERPSAEYLARSLLILLAFGVLMNADVSLVKHYFSEADAGRYARAATMARSIVFLPMPVAIALFPKVVSGGARSVEATRLLLRAGLYVVALIAAVALAGMGAAPWLWRAFTGEAADAASLGLLRLAIGAMAPLGLVYLLANFEMAQNRFAGPAMLFVAAALYLGGVAVRHARITDVLWVLGAANLVAVAALVLFIRPSPPEARAVRGQP